MVPLSGPLIARASTPLWHRGRPAVVFQALLVLLHQIVHASADIVDDALGFGMGCPELLFFRLPRAAQFLLIVIAKLLEFLLVDIHGFLGLVDLLRISHDAAHQLGGCLVLVTQFVVREREHGFRQPQSLTDGECVAFAWRTKDELVGGLESLDIESD